MTLWRGIGMPIYAWLLPFLGIAGIISFLFSHNPYELLFGIVALIWGIGIYRRRAALSRPHVVTLAPLSAPQTAETSTSPTVGTPRPAPTATPVSTGSSVSAPEPPAAVRSAANWFIIASLFDRLAAPSRWVWGEKDLAQDAVLNGHFAATLGPVPPPITEWSDPEGGSRSWINVLGLDVPPHYFPTAASDTAVQFTVAKAVYVDEVRKQNIELLQSVARMGREATQSDFEGLSNGCVYLVPAQYEAFHPWFITYATDYALNPGRRAMDLKLYLNGLFFAADESTPARSLFADMGHRVYVVPSSATSVLQYLGIEHVV
jgi:hypothetical protein